MPFWCSTKPCNERRSPGGSGGRRLRRFPAPSTPRLAIPSNSTPNDGAYRRFSAPLQPPARSDFEAPIRLAGQEGAVQSQTY